MPVFKVLPEYRYTHEYRNEDTNALLTIQFTAREVSDSIVDEIGAGYLAELVALPSRWYLDDVQSEEVA